MAGVFKAYDIRGTYPDQIDEKLAEKIGFAIATFLKARTLVVGRDMRLSSPAVAAAAIEGARRAGADVLSIGLASTPMAYFGIGSLGADGGFNVTASHNPAQYTGFKICREDAIPLSGETGIQEIERIVGELPDTLPAAAKPGRLEERDIRGSYLEHVMSFAGPIRPMKVVVDTANGMGGLMLPEILDHLPLEATPLYFELDGSFPNHEADPLKARNLRDLIARMGETGAELGIAFDGDADRCMFVDETGTPVGADLITALVAPEILKKYPGAGVVYDLRSSRVVPETIARAGGRPIRERVGHSFIKATMRRENGKFGGELSGHFYFADNYYSDSGEIAMLMVLGVLSASGKPMSRLIAPLQRTVRSGEINFRVDSTEAKIRALADAFSDAEIDYKDGITIQYPDWWCNVRPSNTEPLLRLNLEAEAEPAFAQARRRILGLLGDPV
jgi:phosphomannomutase